MYEDEEKRQKMPEKGYKDLLQEDLQDMLKKNLKWKENYLCLILIQPKV